MIRKVGLNLLTLLLITNVPVASAEDELAVLLKKYAAEVKKLRDINAPSEVRQEFDKDWLEKFNQSLEDHPNSPHRRSVMTKVVGLANSTGNWEISKKLTAELAIVGDPPKVSLFWLMEYGEVSYNAFLSTANEEHLNDAIAAFQKGVDLASNESKIVPPDTKYRAIQGGVMLVEILAKEKKATAKEINELLLTLDNVIDSLPPNVRSSLEQVGYGPERLAKTQLHAAIYLKQQDMAEVALEKLLKLSESNKLKDHFSSLLLQVANPMWPEKGAEYREFLSTWRARAEQDPWRGHVDYAIMTSAYSDKAYQEVIDHGEAILGESGQALRESDSKRPEPKQVTYMSETYGMLTQSCFHLGLHEKANKYRKLLETIAPNDYRLREPSEVP